MAQAVYEVLRQNEREWIVKHDEDVAGPYVTKEAAFEAAVASAGAAMAQGHEVQLKVQGGAGRWS